MQKNKFETAMKTFYSHIFPLKNVSVLFLTSMIMFAINSNNNTFASSSEMAVMNNPTKQELLNRWTKYLHALGSIEGIKKYCDKGNGVICSEFTNHIVYLYPYLLEKRNSKNGSEYARVFGNRYDFCIQRDNSTVPWAIERLEIKPEHRDLNSWTFPEHYGSSQDDLVGYNIFNFSGVGLFADKSTPNLPDIFRSNHLKILKMETIENEGKKQIHLEFDYSYDHFPEKLTQQKQFENYRKNNPNIQYFSLKAEVVLETDYYLISKGKFHTIWLSEEWDSDVECEFDMTAHKVPLPKHYKRITRHPSKLKRTPNISELTIDFDLHETNPKDDKRFTLSAFGLPEPDFSERRPSRIRFILMFLGAALIGTGLWQMYKKRQETKP